MPRAFIAIQLPVPSKLQPVFSQLNQLGRAVKPVPPHNFHLTLRFLGQIENNLLAPIATLLQQATTGVPTLELNLKNLGAFPTPDRPSVVWVGLDNTSANTNPTALGHLNQIVTRLEQGLTQLGLPPESRPWIPHATLARVKFKPPPALFDLLRENTHTPFGSFTAKRVDLMASDRTPAGPRYTVAASAYLGAPAPRHEKNKPLKK